MKKCLFFILIPFLLYSCPSKESSGDENTVLSEETAQRQEQTAETGMVDENTVEPDKVTTSKEEETNISLSDIPELSLSPSEAFSEISGITGPLSFWNPEEVLSLRMEYPDYGWEDPPIFITTGGEPRIKVVEGHTTRIFIVDWKIPSGGCALELTDPRGETYSRTLSAEDLIPLQLDQDQTSGILFEPPLIPLLLEPPALYPPGQWRVKVLSEGQKPVEKKMHLGLNFSLHKKLKPTPFDKEYEVTLNKGETATFFYRSDSKEIYFGLYRYTGEYEEDPVYTEIYTPIAVFSCSSPEEGLYSITIQNTEKLTEGNYMIGLITHPDKNPEPLKRFSVD